MLEICFATLMRNKGKLLYVLGKAISVDLNIKLLTVKSLFQQWLLLYNLDTPGSVDVVHQKQNDVLQQHGMCLL